MSYRKTSDIQAEQRRELYLATETYVRRVLRTIGQREDADDPRLVGRIVSEILRNFPVWLDPASGLRKSEEELELGPRVSEALMSKPR